MAFILITLSVISAVSVALMVVYQISDILLQRAVGWLRLAVQAAVPEPKPRRTVWDDWREWKEYLSFTDLEPIQMAYAAVLVVALFYVLSKIVGGGARYVRRTILWLRGVKGFSYEAIKPGSEFMPGRWPAWQVPLYHLGTFHNSFIGFGFRYGEVLVLPRHVYDLIPDGEMVVGGTGYFDGYLVRTAPVDGAHSDLLYIPLAPEIWASLGVKAASLSRDMGRPVNVQCGGLSGYSMGILRKCPTQVGMVSYSGSTEPGMSGATYYALGHVYGMHIGCMNGDNMGISSQFIAADYDSIFQTEAKKKRQPWSFSTGGGHIVASSSGDQSKDDRLQKKFAQPTWTQSDVDQAIEKARAGDWASAVDLEERGVAWESNDVYRVLMSMPRVKREALLSLVKAEQQVDDAIPVIRQDAPAGERVPYNPKPLGIRVTELEAQVALLTQMVLRMLPTAEAPRSPTPITPEAVQPKVVKVSAVKEVPKVAAAVVVQPPKKKSRMFDCRICGKLHPGKSRSGAEYRCRKLTRPGPSSQPPPQMPLTKPDKKGGVKVKPEAAVGPSEKYSDKLKQDNTKN